MTDAEEGEGGSIRRRDPMISIDITEAQLQQRVVQYAVQQGWDWMHIGRVGKHVANGAKGTLGIGWPDLTLIRGRRVIFAELKAQKAPPPGSVQREVLEKLLATGVEVYVWRPSDMAQILEELA